MPTMRMRLAAPALIAALALVGAGCGGGSSKSKQSASASGGPSGAEVIPAGAPAFVSFNTDLESDQVKQADTLSKKFPARAKAIADIRKDMAKDGVDWDRDVKPALGPEIDVAWLDLADNGSNVVAVTQPKDEAKFAAVLEKANKGEKDKVYMAKIGDWTALADSTAKLERLKSAQNGAKLADADRFKEAIADLPGEALVKVYVNGPAVRAAVQQNIVPNVGSSGIFGKAIPNVGWLSASAESATGGVGFQAGVKGAQKDVSNYTSKLVDRLPAGALFDFSFNNLAAGVKSSLKAFEDQPGFSAQKQQLEQALGMSVENDVLPLFANEGALAVYPSAAGSRIPAVELVFNVTDEAKARRIIERLGALAQLGGAVTVRPVTIAGVAAHELRLSSSLSLFYGIFDDALALSNSKSALAGLVGTGNKLAQDPLFTAAKSGAKGPDDTSGFVYVNLHAAFPELFKDLGVSTSDADIAELRANLMPLQSFFAYGTKDGDVTRLAGFLAIE
jgi:uncharacterized protein DUF3352